MLPPTGQTAERLALRPQYPKGWWRLICLASYLMPAKRIWSQRTSTTEGIFDIDYLAFYDGLGEHHDNTKIKSLLWSE